MSSRRVFSTARAIAVLGWLFVALCAVGLVAEIAAGVRDNWPAEVALVASILLVTVALLRARPTSTVAGGTMLGLGVIPAAVVQVWTVVIPLLALVLIGLTVARARELPRSPGALGQAGDSATASSS